MKIFLKKQHFFTKLLFFYFVLIIFSTLFLAIEFFYQNSLSRQKKLLAEEIQCPDGTPLNQCSGRGNNGLKGRPMYCVMKPNTGIPFLIQNCEECGCKAGYYCTPSSLDLGPQTPKGQCFPESFAAAFNSNPLFSCRLNSPTLTGNINMRGADLGIPIWHNNQIYYFFGDALDSTANDPYAYSGTEFCPTLNWFTDANGEMASMIDWPIVPGSNVAGGGISLNGKIYIFFMYNDWNGPASEDSYLVKSENDGLTFEKVAGVAWGPDTKFLNIAPIAGQLNGQQVIFFLATGNYGASPIYLGYTTDIENISSYHYYTGLNNNIPIWSANPDAAQPVININNGRELSVQWSDYLNKYLAVYTYNNSGSNLMYYASSPQLWGPWEIQPITEINNSPHDDWYGFYGGYIIPQMSQGNNLYLVISSWVPYTSYIIQLDLNNYEEAYCRGNNCNLNKPDKNIPLPNYNIPKKPPPSTEIYGGSEWIRKFKKVFIIISPYLLVLATVLLIIFVTIYVKKQRQAKLDKDKLDKINKDKEIKL